jgi:hypothetical protein
MPGSSTGSERMPASAPTSAPEAPRARRGWVALALASAAAASSWNPLGAPFAVVAGAGAAALAVRALRRGDGRRVAAAALALAAAAVVASLLVLAAAAGLWTHPEQSLGLDQREAAEVRRVLDEEAARSRDARGRAHEELDHAAGERRTGKAPESPTSR